MASIVSADVIVICVLAWMESVGQISRIKRAAPISCTKTASTPASASRRTLDSSIGKLVGEDQRVERHVAADPSTVQGSDQFGKVLHREIRRPRSGIKSGLQSKVDSVGAVFDGCRRTFPVSSRCQQLGRWLRTGRCYRHHKILKEGSVVGRSQVYHRVPECYSERTSMKTNFMHLNSMNFIHQCRNRTIALALSVIVIGFHAAVRTEGADELLFLENAQVKLGIDRQRGASITWLEWKEYPKNAVNVFDPGRLIQQSYYSGQGIDRTGEGQSRAWSPWPWNPIQGGGVGSWARVLDFQRTEPATLYSETVPKLWDMPNEEADARMLQWSRFEPEMPDVLCVQCEFRSLRSAADRWGPSRPRHQEIPACYFTRNFERCKSYLGNQRWRDEVQAPGPPWGKADPPRKAMAVFEASGQGIGIFSPAATQPWNFGPHGTKITDDPHGGPCMHVAPLDTAALEPQSAYRFRYWMVVGPESTIAARLDQLWKLYENERAEISTP